MNYSLALRCIMRVSLLIALMFPESAVTAPTEPAMAVITAPSFSKAAIPISTLRAIFGMRVQRWPDGTPVKVFVFGDDAPEHVSFCKDVLQVFPHQLRLAWDRLVFAGLGQYPEKVSTASEMLAKVSETPGAVGYVRTSEVNQDVHVLKIQ